MESRGRWSWNADFDKPRDEYRKFCTSSNEIKPLGNGKAIADCGVGVAFGFDLETRELDFLSYDPRMIGVHSVEALPDGRYAAAAYQRWGGGVFVIDPRDAPFDPKKQKITLEID